MKLFIPSRFLVAVIALVFAGCSSLPGLQVLTGQADTAAQANLVVQELDLVMADKSGATDPSLIASADRIEAANPQVDIIEIRSDATNDALVVNMLYAPPQVDDSIQGTIARLDSERRVFELTWQGLMQASEGADMIRVNLLYPRPVATLDSGQSFIAYIVASADIGREDATRYLTGDRSLQSFYDLIVNGTLAYQTMQEYPLYEGTPNHPMFMLQMTVQ